MIDSVKDSTQDNGGAQVAPEAQGYSDAEWERFLPPGPGSFCFVPGAVPAWWRPQCFSSFRAYEFYETRVDRRAKKKRMAALGEVGAPKRAACVKLTLPKEKAKKLAIGVSVALGQETRQVEKPAKGRRTARQELADFLNAHVMQGTFDPYLAEIAQRLRTARESGVLMHNPVSGKTLRIYDEKTECPLLDPDDAREEAERLRRRYAPTLAHWARDGRQVHAFFLTRPHVEPGQLREGMRAMMKDSAKFLAKFKQVKGALFVMECPLSAARKWNVHINVLLVTDGTFLDYKECRKVWSAMNGRKDCNVQMQRLRGGEVEMQNAMKEIIKYAVQAVPSKSADGKHSKGKDGRKPAPALVQWTKAEFDEWWYAHRRFRRTRSYGVLHGIPKPPPESLDGFIAVGSFHWDKNGNLVDTIADNLLDLIQGYNFEILPLPKGAKFGPRGPPD